MSKKPCWHCSGSKICNCIFCLDDTTGLAGACQWCSVKQKPKAKPKEEKKKDESHEAIRDLYTAD
jgi:hypothetical protein